jgi:hypothetical protein
VSKEIEQTNFGWGSDPKAILHQILTEVVTYKKSA